MTFKWIFVSTIVLIAYARAEESQTAIIDQQVAVIDSIWEHRDTNQVIFCRGADSSQLIRVSDNSTWELCDEWYEYHIMWDSSRNVVLFVETQTSPDDGMAVRHYFRSDGTLAKVNYYLGSFVSECTDILRDERHWYYSAAGDVIVERRSITDRDQKPFDTTGCMIREWEYLHFKTAEEVKSAFGL